MMKISPHSYRCIPASPAVEVLNWRMSRQRADVHGKLQSNGACVSCVYLHLHKHWVGTRAEAGAVVKGLFEDCHPLLLLAGMLEAHYIGWGLLSTGLPYE